MFTSVEACVYPYGSSVSNFALVDSDVNVDIEVNNPAEFLMGLREVLRHDKTGVDPLWILDTSSNNCYYR